MTDDKWAIRDYQRVCGENQILRRELARLNAEVAQLKLKILLDAEREKTDVAWLQGKVRRQKAELNRINGVREAERIVMELDA